MPHPTFKGTIKGDDFKLDNPEQFKKYLTSLKYKTKEITPIRLSVKRFVKKRTSGQAGEKSNQNGYLWGVVYPIICDYHGYAKHEMHHAIKNKFFRIGGTDELPKVQSTTEINKQDWEVIMEEIRVYYSTEHNLEIPTVGDYYDGIVQADFNY